MRKIRLIALGTAFAFLASLVAYSMTIGHAVAGEKGKTYRLHLKDVEVETTKEDGEAWDINDGKPDIRVNIRNLSDKSVKEFESKTKDDTFKAEYNEPTILASVGHNLEIEVVDVDVAFNDRIGLHKLTLTEEMVEKGKLELSFGRVKTLNVEFKSN